MWLCVDRIEENTVVLLDDQEKVYCLAADAYIAMVGRKPAEGDMLTAEIEEGSIRLAAYDEGETEARKVAARERLNRLFGRR
ncbi:MAG: DUF3006 domain-containing protein [Clostridia bacterium]|nr:DUF3006 domain-containing protein [Clostridia bacterium]